MKPISLSSARRMIVKTRNREVLLFEDGGVPEILQVIFSAGKLAPDFTKDFAPRLRGRNDYETLRNVWRFVKYNVVYKRDRPGKEVVKSPGKLIYDGHGDCKSFTIIVVALLTNLGIGWRYRVAFYDPSTPDAGHIYPVAELPERSVVVDAVHKRFDDEVRYWKAGDYSPNGTALAQLSGTAAPVSVNKLLLWAAAFWMLHRLSKTEKEDA